MTSIFGIDLGGSGSTLCYVWKGAVDTALNEASKRRTPSLVSFYNGQRYIGEPASSLEGSNYRNTVRAIKRLVGRTWSEADAQREISSLPNASRYSKGPDDTILVEVDHCGSAVKFDTTTLLAMQLSGLKTTCERTLHESKGTPVQIRDVVVGVPNYFTDAQRRCMLDAVRVAGLNPLRLVNDSTAVALDYGMWKNARGAFDAEKRTFVMFVDVGESDAWTSVVAYVKGKLTVLATVCDPNLGGRDVDSALALKFAVAFNAKNKALDPRKDSKAMIKLLKAAEKAKQVLTPEGMTKAEVNVEYLMNETDLRMFLTAEELDQYVLPLASRLEALVRRALDESGVKPQELAGVEMIGGSSRMRQFKRAVASALNLPAAARVPPNYGVLTTLNADESVARGCALMCAVESPQVRITTVFETVEYVPLPVSLRWDQPSESTGGLGVAAHEEGAMEDVVEAGAAASSPPKPGGPATLPIFQRTSDTPKTRKVTFRRSEPFEIMAEYEADPGLPADAPRRIASVRVSGMPKDAARGKIAIMFNHTKSGTFTCTSAVYTVTVDDDTPPVPAASTPPVPSPQAGSEVPAPAPDATAGAPPPPAEKKKKTVKTDLTVTTTYYGSPTQAQVAAMQRSEAELAATDRALRERVDTRNKLEEFLYSCRDQVEGALREYATPAEAEQLKRTIGEEQEWLYESGDDAKTEEFSKKLANVHKIFDKINDRALELPAREAACARANAAVEGFLQSVNSGDAAYAHLSEEERQTVRAECSRFIEWLSKQRDAQAALPLNADPALTSSVIDDHVSKLQGACRPITSKPKPKPPPAPPATDKPSPSPPSASPPPTGTPTQENGGSGEPQADAGGEDAAPSKRMDVVEPEGAPRDVVDKDMDLD